MHYYRFLHHLKIFRQSARQCLFFVQNGGSVYTKGAVSAFSKATTLEVNCLNNVWINHPAWRASYGPCIQHYVRLRGLRRKLNNGQPFEIYPCHSPFFAGSSGFTML